MDFPKKLGIPDYQFRLIFGKTKIDYDVEKEMVNRQKHGYSLVSAVHLLEKVLLPIKSTPFVTTDAFKENEEVRHIHMGVDDEGNVVYMVTTMRSDETVRVISFRRASEEERELFYSLTGYKS
ncbi:MAG TPA: BrnT family toxin [Nitrospinota bacterium]|nr:BrnT family toxin [Nitrospinota bacterium]